MYDNSGGKTGGKKFFCAYHSYSKAIEPLNDSERGRLFTALLNYSEQGVEQELRGNERFIFPSMRAQIDRDTERYNAIAKRNVKNGKCGGRPKTQNNPNNPLVFLETQKSQGEGKGEREGKGKGEGEGENNNSDRETENGVWMSDADARALQNEHNQVFDLAEQIEMPMDAYSLTVCERLMADYSPAWVLSALHATGMANEKAKAWRYVEGVLKGYREDGGPGNPKKRSDDKPILAEYENIATPDGIVRRKVQRE